MNTADANEVQVRALYQRLLESWNRRDARDFAALFAEDAHVIGFDGSQMHGREEIELGAESNLRRPCDSGLCEQNPRGAPY